MILPTPVQGTPCLGDVVIRKSAEHLGFLLPDNKPQPNEVDHSEEDQHIMKLAEYYGH
mgnify:FL=1